MVAKTPEILKKLYYSLVWNFSTEEKKIYLTFDDGPHPEITVQVLELLDKFKAKATFFCIGRNVDRFPDIYFKIIEHGHSAGNHTYSHLNGWKTNNKEYFKDIEAAGHLIDSNLFRPPYGRIKRSQFKHLRNLYNILMWDVMPGDFDYSISSQKCLENVLLNTKPGSIIVLHDSEKSHERMIYTLPRVLDYFSDKGYEFSSITKDNFSCLP